MPTYPMKKLLSTKPTTAKAAGEAFLKSRRFDGLSYHYIRTAKRYTQQFIRKFGPRELDSITPEELLGSAEKRWGPATKENYFRVIRTFCSWARDNDYLPHDRRTVAERVRKTRVILPEPEFFSPDEMRRLLSVAGLLVGGEEEYLLSLLVLGGFAGLRVSEICRLQWEDISITPTHQAVRLSPKITKTGARRIALLSENATSWLKHIKNRTGFVVPQWVIPNLNRYTGKLAKEAGVTWKNNGLRHSYVTYAVARERDSWKVAEQVGNSPRILQAHYKGLVMDTDADEWFGITPDNTL